MPSQLGIGLADPGAPIALVDAACIVAWIHFHLQAMCAVRRLDVAANVESTIPFKRLESELHP